jgi:predicted RNase H-like HicB family nuclease
MERKVVIASAKSNAAARTQFSGSTFGELKADAVFASIYGSGEGVEAIVKPGNVTLRDDASVLPEGEFSVFLVPTKNKAGNDLGDLFDEIEEAIDNHNDTILSELREAVKGVLSKYTAAEVNPTGDDELDAAMREARSL